MSAKTKVSALDHAMQTAHTWVHDVAREFDTEDGEFAYRVLRAWLHTLRDRLRMSRVPWNFGGGPVSIRLRSPDHCAPQVRQIRRTRVPARRAVSAGAGDRSHVGTACRPRPSRPRTSAAPSARRATA